MRETEGLCTLKMYKMPVQNEVIIVRNKLKLRGEPAGFLSYSYGIIINIKVLLVGGECPPNPPKNKGNIKECF